MTTALPVVGVDIGGTRIKACTLTAAGEVLADIVLPTPRDLAETMGATVAGIVSRLGPFHGADGTPFPSPAALGVVAPGYVDDAAGIGFWSANLGWRDLPIRDLVASATGVPVRVGHDVRAGLLAEHYFGAARGVSDAIFLPIGTGIAAAVLSGGELVSGHPASGELGHVVVDPQGPVCGCGRTGCLEAVASARAIAATVSSLQGRECSAIDVAAGVRAGDEIASYVWSTAIAHLARVLASAPVPLVLHGSSGVDDAGLVAAVEAGMGKVNIATHLNQVFTGAALAALEAKPGLVDTRKYLGAGRDAVAAETARLQRLLALTSLGQQGQIVVVDKVTNPDA